ncbi:MAG: DUF1559 domain-containing protein [Pirellulales bacterium]|nr:DUF1559 domain-containing protein [Pirellulales bacterium]
MFFSYPAAYHLRLTKVERDGESITVRYRYQPHWSAESTVHFALIPLGRLPARKYNVKFEQDPMEQKYQDAGFLRVWQERKTVALPFSFTIYEPPSPTLAEPDKDAVQIALKEIWSDGMPGTRDISELEPRAADDHHSAGPILQEIRMTLRAYERKLGVWTGILVKGGQVNKSSTPPQVWKFPTVDFKGIEDGSSNTILAAEKAAPSQYWTIPGAAPWPYWEMYGYYTGADWPHMRLFGALKTTGPNPSGEVPLRDDSASRGASTVPIPEFGFGSAHPQVLCSVWGDGSTRMISAAADLTILDQLGKRADGTSASMNDL